MGPCAASDMRHQPTTPADKNPESAERIKNFPEHILLTYRTPLGQYTEEGHGGEAERRKENFT